VSTRIVVGRDRVAQEIRAAAPLARRLRAPVTARAPWLTAVLDVRAARRWTGRPVAVVAGPADAPPEAAAFLWLRRRGARTAVTLLGDGVPVPAGSPPARLLAADDDAAARLAGGLADLLGGLRGPWSLSFTGLPLGDPTSRRLAERFPAARMATVRTTRLVDALDGAGPVLRTRAPRDVERELPALLAREPYPEARDLLRALTRVHAATGGLELAVLRDDGGAPRGGLLTLLDGPAATPWWATPGLPGVRAERGSPSATVTVAARPGR
jgi:hypothetical protein